jgi:polar amino acid transport system permease protein
MDYVMQIMGPLLEGTGVTLQVFVITFVLAVPLGLCLALLRVSRLLLPSAAWSTATSG